MLLFGAVLGNDVVILLCGANVVVWCCAPPSQSANHPGAICAHSLTSELVDSALLGYLRLSLRSTVRREANPFFSAQKAKRQSPERATVFLANNHDFDTRLLPLTTFTRIVGLFTIITTEIL